VTLLVPQNVQPRPRSGLTPDTLLRRRFWTRRAGTSDRKTDGGGGSSPLSPCPSSASSSSCCHIETKEDLAVEGVVAVFRDRSRASLRQNDASCGAELLLLSDATLARATGSNGLFEGNRTDPRAQRRFELAESHLRKVSPEFSKALTAAWNSETLDACPRISDLLAKMNQDAAGPFPTRG
jgi:hypothetical protein